MADNLFAILATIRTEMPEVSDEAWAKIKRFLGATAGGSRVYVPSYRQRARLETLATADAATDAATLAKLLGVSVRHTKRLKKLR